MNILLRNTQSYAKKYNLTNPSITNIYYGIYNKTAYTQYLKLSYSTLINESFTSISFSKKLPDIEQVYSGSYRFLSDNSNKTMVNRRTMLNTYIDIQIKRNHEPFSPVHFKNSDIQQKFKQTIDIMRDPKNHNIMRQCYFEICKICKMYPPRKNENKMIYGKMVEAAIGNALSKMNIECIDLDKLCNVGSEYKNDFKLGEIMLSLKTKKNKRGNIILINTHSTLDHGDNLKINVLLCIIESGKLYFIPYDLVDESIFVKHNPGNIAYANSILKYMENHYSDFIYTFPELSENQGKEISTISEHDLIRTLYTVLQNNMSNDFITRVSEYKFPN